MTSPGGILIGQTIFVSPRPTHERAQARLALLGERLFGDTRLSADGKVSCASCHIKANCFTDARPHAVGLDKQQGTRNTPSLINVGFLQSLFWDGRVPTLDEQVVAPLTNPIEHGLENEQAVLNLVKRDPQYVLEFTTIFGNGAQPLQFSHIASALAAYQQTLVTTDSLFDRYFFGKDLIALPAAALRGLKLFQGRAGCVSCHSIDTTHALFTDQQFHDSPLGLPHVANTNLGELAARIGTLHDQKRITDLHRLVATDASVAALGRFVVTLDPHDIGKFRTPSLRNVARTAPYMHDGSVESLEKAIDLELYGRDDLKYPIVLTAAEKVDLVQFLNTLTGTECRAPL